MARGLTSSLYVQHTLTAKCRRKQLDRTYQTLKEVLRMGGVTTRDVTAVHQPRTGVGATAKGRSARRFWSWEADWGKIGLYVSIIALVLFSLYFAGFCVNYGPSMNHLGWTYWVDWGRAPEVGEVFRFAPADKPAWYRYLPLATWVKRCTAITPEGYVFEGDNTEWSLDQREFGRDVMAPVPASHISGTVWAAFHPRRVTRWFTSWGRKTNLLEMKYSPKEMFVGPRVVVLLRYQEEKAEYQMSVLSPQGQVFSRPLPGRGAPLGWKGGRFEFIQGIDELRDALWVYIPPPVNQMRVEGG